MDIEVRNLKTVRKFLSCISKMDEEIVFEIGNTKRGPNVMGEQNRVTYNMPFYSNIRIITTYIRRHNGNKEE